MTAPRSARRAAGLAAALSMAAVLAACQSATSPGASATIGTGATGSPAPSEPGAPGSSGGAAGASQPVPASPAQGVVLHVDSAGLGQVTDFTLLTGGRQILFTMGKLEDPLDFPAAHLAEHVASSEPVRVYFRVEGPALVVYRLEDASASPSPGSASPSAG